MKVNLKPAFLKSNRTPEWFRYAYPKIISGLEAGNSFEEIHTNLISNNPKIMKTSNGQVTVGNLTNMMMRLIRNRQVPDFSHLKGFNNRVYVEKITRAYEPTPTGDATAVITTPIVAEPRKQKLNLTGGLTLAESQVKAITEVIQSNMSDATKLRFIRRELNV